MIRILKFLFEKCDNFFINDFIFVYSKWEKEGGSYVYVIVRLK